MSKVGALTTINRTFKIGDCMPLNYVYEILGIIPLDAYEQDDIADYTRFNGNDGGESIRFIKNVTIKIKMTVYD